MATKTKNAPKTATTNKATKKAVPTPTSATPAAEADGKKMSALEAAAKVLAEKGWRWRAPS